MIRRWRWLIYRMITKLLSWTVLRARSDATKEIYECCPAPG
jgi:hypothetical protein